MFAHRNHQKPQVDKESADISNRRRTFSHRKRIRKTVDKFGEISMSSIVPLKQLPRSWGSPKTTNLIMLVWFSPLNPHLSLKGQDKETEKKKT